MRVRAFLLPIMLWGASACAEQPGPPEPPPPRDVGARSAEIIAQEVNGANGEADGALRLSRLVLGRLGADDIKDQATAVERVANGTGGGLGAQCATSARTEPSDPGAVYVTFDGCREPADGQIITGTLRFFFGKAPGVLGIRVQVGIAPGSSLTVDGASVPEYRIDAMLSFPAPATAVMAWEVALARQGGEGPDLRLAARFRTVVKTEGAPGEAQRECSTTSGRASFEAGERGASFDVDGLFVCRAPLMLRAACPSGGTWSVTDDEARTVTFQFTGRDAEPGPGGAPRTILQVTDAEGEPREISVRCGARAGAS
ncbi:MAG TPA: hypothetical protein VFS43_46205 [Polyangiaceae bacterium]|nr:hypothetical protein [Polyangiaceae bacterium]